MLVVVDGSTVDNVVCLWSRTLILENDSETSAKGGLEGMIQKEGNDLEAMHQLYATCRGFFFFCANITCRVNTICRMNE